MMHEGFHRLDYQSGGFILIQSPSLARALHVRAYHLELLHLVRQFEHYDLLEADGPLFEEYAFYYQAIADQLLPVVKTATLTPASRHAFFVAGASEPDPADPAKSIVGLPGLERLMGYLALQPPTSTPTQPTTPPPPSTGELVLDVMASLLIIRPPNLDWISKQFSPQQLAQILNQVGSLNQSEDTVSEAQHEQDRQWATQNQAAIEAAFQKQGATGFLG